MVKVNVNDVLAWQPVIMMLANLGVSSFKSIHDTMSNAGADAATIAAMQAKWDILVNDVRRAAGQ